jgi:flagellar motor switch protein FliM
MGEKFGKDSIWEEHLAREIWNTQIPVDAVLTEMRISLQKLLALKVGDTIMLECGPSDPVSVRSGHVELARGFMGRKGDYIAIRLDNEIRSRRAIEA